jgi:hypothetical protein
MSMRILTAALTYAGRGLAVFPACAAVKKSHKCAEHSNGARWGATADPAEVRRDFSRWPHARIGVPTGVVNRIVVVDVDTIEGHGIDGAASLAQLEARHGPLPDTRMACSPSGSIHRYFRHPGPNIKIKTTASVIGAGSTCAVTAAWSLRRRRSTSTAQRAVAAIRPPIEASSKYGAAALRNELANIHRAEPGHRNAVLNKAGFSLGNWW